MPEPKPQPVTIDDIAREAGVHPASVSRALRGIDKKVSPATREKIERIARELGYRPNAVAASLRTRRTNLVGVIVPDLANPLFGPLVQGIEVALRAHGLMCLVVHTPDPADERRALVAALAHRQVSGLLILAAEHEDPLLAAAHDFGIPTVLVNRGFGERRFPSVVNDDHESVRLVLEHLAALGHKRIAHVAGPRTSSTGHARRKAFDELCASMGLEGQVVEAAAFTRAAGLEPASRLFDEGSDGEARQRAGRAAVEARGKKRHGSGSKGRSAGLPSGPPTAIFAGNDLLAMAVLDVLHQRGLRVPEDVSVVGHNDMPLVDLIAPPLTTIHVAVDEMGRQAAQLLLEHLRTPSQGNTMRVLSPTLVVRASTAPAR